MAESKILVSRGHDEHAALGPRTSRTSPTGAEDVSSASQQANVLENASPVPILNDSGVWSTQGDLFEDSWMPLLARQIEFYFSPSNLARDVYLQTIRSSHDGYVPASILANFAKVTALTPPTSTEEDRIRAVCKASRQYSEQLEVVSLSQKTLKRIPLEAESQEGQSLSKRPPRLVAIGLMPEQASSLSTPPLTPTRSVVQNTIILRDVSSDVKEEAVRSLFEFEGCPPIQNVHLDVANCWFVTLDTTSRDDMMNVMLALRSETLNGEPLKARLKSVASVLPSASPIPILMPPPPFYPMSVMMPSPTSTVGNTTPLQPTLSPRRSSKKNRRNRSKTSRGYRGKAHKHAAKNGANSKESSDDKKHGAATITKLEPRPLLEVGESHFPALPPSFVTNNPTTTKTLLDNMDEVHKSTNTTDNASTVTTQSASSSSSLSKENKTFAAAATGAVTLTTSSNTSGGYAAVLMKGASSVRNTSSKSPATVKVETSLSNENDDGKSKAASKEATSISTARESTVGAQSQSDVPTPMKPASVWGKGLSFADIVSSSS